MGLNSQFSNQENEVQPTFRQMCESLSQSRPPPPDPSESKVGFLSPSTSQQGMSGRRITHNQRHRMES